MTNDVRVSGNIYASPDEYEECGYRYVVVNRVNQGWGIPTKDLTPDDLRAMADHLDAALNGDGKPESKSNCEIQGYCTCVTGYCLKALNGEENG